jgi:folate-binding protein YgfZ
MPEIGTTIGDVGGRSVVLAYGSVAAEYEALHSRAAVFDRSHRGRIRMKGARAAEMVTGLVTNDVSALAPGQGCYAAALTAKGKIVADVRVFVEEDGVLVDAPPRAAAAWAAMVKKFVNPRIAPHQDESATLRDIGIFGATARHVVSELTGVQAPALTALAPYSHVSVQVDGATIIVAKVPDLDVEGFELIVPADVFSALWMRTVAAGATPAGLEAWEIARVEAGRPEWGVDIDDNTIPQEANFDALHAISYTKGCYVGQETVARVHFRGHVNRHLRGLRFEVPAAADAVVGAPAPASRAEDTELPPPRAQLVDDSGKAVGDVRSAARSPRFGPIALAMVRRELAVGDSVAVRWGGGDVGDAPAVGLSRELRAIVTALPFGR